MSPFDPKKPQGRVETTQRPQPAPAMGGGARAIVRDLPPEEPEWEPEPEEQFPQAVVMPENQPEGDRDAFLRWLQKRWGSSITQRLVATGLSERSREELEQHVRLVTCTEYEKTGPIRHLDAFIDVVIENELRNRHGKRTPDIVDGAEPDELATSSRDPESAAARAEQWERIKRYVNALPEELAKVIVARVFEGLTLEATALKLGIPVTNVFNHQVSAVKQLRELARASDRRVGGK